ncbi:hypothetical protein BV20DRAFT_1053890 [Pilatotrama ljubarskyi]|nr:hypothetical protein BV20DRAFT_1053890 [Pilatotrama ljubarskyi]
MADSTELELAATALRREGLRVLHRQLTHQLAYLERSPPPTLTDSDWDAVADWLSSVTKDYLSLTGDLAGFDPLRERIEALLRARNSQPRLLAHFRLAYALGLRQASESVFRLDGLRLEQMRERADTAVRVLQSTRFAPSATLQAAWSVLRELDRLQQVHRAATTELDRLEEQCDEIAAGFSEPFAQVDPLAPLSLALPMGGTSSVPAFLARSEGSSAM